MTGMEVMERGRKRKGSERKGRRRKRGTREWKKIKRRRPKRYGVPSVKEGGGEGRE